MDAFLLDEVNVANNFGKRVTMITMGVGLLVLGFLGYWQFSRKSQDPVELMIADFQKRSTPPAGKLVSSSELERGRFSVTASWEIESNEEWNAYSKWVTARFMDFKIRPLNGKIDMLKQLPGDTLHLSIERVGEKPLRVRITFTGSAS